MKHIRTIIGKEWAEVFKNKLVLSVLLIMPVLFSLLPLVMLADGGTNYHGVLAVLQLCWIHMLRPFSLLAEGTDSARVLTEGWALYSRIKAFREAPEPIDAAAIATDFDRVFDPPRLRPRAMR